MIFKAYSARTPTTFVMANRLSDALDRYPTAYLSLQKVRLLGNPVARRLVTPAHEMMIEGFPRSGNSFAHRAFVQANPSCHGLIATHVHRSAHVAAALRYRVPTLVMLRRPEAAAVSLLAFNIQNGQLPILTTQEAQSCIAEVLQRYIRFYERVVKMDGAAIAQFEDVTKDYGAVIRSMNYALGTNFAPFVHDESSVAALFSKSRKHLSPNAERDQIKETLAKAYSAQAQSALRERAEAAWLEAREITLKPLAEATS